MRDRPTLLSYGALGAYSFWLYAFGPAVALLRSELGLSYTMVGVYSAAWSLGAVIAGTCYAPLTGRVSRRHLLWCPALAVTAGAGVFAVSTSVASTLTAALVMGISGTALQMATQSVLSDSHGSRRGQALVEANIGAGASAVAAPMALGGLAATAAGWRPAMALPALAFAILYGLFGRQALPGAPDSRDPGRRGVFGLPAACWLLCLLVAAGIGVEFCVVYFGAELLESAAHLAPAAAATAMTAYYAGILAGRLGGARLMRQRGRGVVLLWASVAVTLAGLLAMVLAGGKGVEVGGLFAAGAGVANLFPLSLALALGTAGELTDTANGLAQLLGGLLVLGAPFSLGVLADHAGLLAGFAIAPLLTVACAALLYAGLRLGHRPSTES